MAIPAKEYVHQRVVKTIKQVRYLSQSFSCLFPFRWWFIDYNWNRLEDNTWLVKVTWVRKTKESLIGTVVDAKTSKITVGDMYPRVKLRHALQLLWFYMRSRKYDPKDEGTVQSEARPPESIFGKETFETEGAFEMESSGLVVTAGIPKTESKKRGTRVTSFNVPAGLLGYYNKRKKKELR